MIDFVFITGKNYYPQVFLEECKSLVKEKKIPKHIIDGIETFSDSDRKNSDEWRRKRKKAKKGTRHMSKSFLRRKRKKVSVSWWK